MVALITPAVSVVARVARTITASLPVNGMSNSQSRFTVATVPSVLVFMFVPPVSSVSGNTYDGDVITLLATSVRFCKRKP